jgi:YbbR domain-containing protein
MKQLWERIVALAGSNFGLKALALTIAVGLWLAGHRDIERSIEVPVEFRNIPSDLMVMDNRVDFVVLRVTGPRTLVSTIDADELKLLLDVNTAKPGTVSYPLAGSSFNIPRGVSVARITPPVIHLRMEPVIKLTLPVSVRTSGKPAAGFRISQTLVQPARVTVQGPAEEVRRLTAVETVPVDLNETRGVPKRLARLATGGKPLTFSPDQVEVSVTLEEEQVIREFAQVEIGAKDFKGVYTINPKTIFLRVSGPKNLVDKLELSSVSVFVKLQGLTVGDHNLPPQFDLPNGVKVVEHKPAKVRVKIAKPAA